MISHVAKFVAVWTCERVQLLVMKAPREVPRLLFVVLVLAVVLIVLYAYILANPNV
jgi:hypothetical protein